MSVTRLTLLAAAAVLAGAAAFSTLAQDASQDAGNHGARFAARDTNHDGFIDKSEASASMLARFDMLDADHDGRLTREEIRSGFRAAIKARWQERRDDFRQRRMDDLDSNKDGKIGWDEMSARAKVRFDALDTNHDGFIDETEMAQARGQRHRHWGDGNASPAQ